MGKPHKDQSRSGLVDKLRSSYRYLYDVFWIQLINRISADALQGFVQPITVALHGHTVIFGLRLFFHCNRDLVSKFWRACGH